MVAEDNVVNQKVVIKLLQKWEHTFVLAQNGAEAVEKSTKEAFDLILMDVSGLFIIIILCWQVLLSISRVQNVRPIIAFFAYGR